VAAAAFDHTVHAHLAGLDQQLRLAAGERRAGEL
jgi:hypothetical protein